MGKLYLYKLDIIYKCFSLCPLWAPKNLVWRYLLCFSYLRKLHCFWELIKFCYFCSWYTKIPFLFFNNFLAQSTLWYSFVAFAESWSPGWALPLPSSPSCAVLIVFVSWGNVYQNYPFLHLSHPSMSLSICVDVRFSLLLPGPPPRPACLSQNPGHPVMPEALPGASENPPVLWTSCHTTCLCPETDVLSNVKWLDMNSKEKLFNCSVDVDKCDAYKQNWDFAHSNLRSALMPTEINNCLDNRLHSQ